MNRKPFLALCLVSLMAAFHGGASAAQQTDTQFPDPASSYRTEGLFPNVANLRNMGTGLTKPQVLDLLGAPHFSEGLFGVREWNYIFNLRDASGNVTQCQYKVLYDDQMKVRGTLWNKPGCADLLNPPAPVAAQPTPEPVRAPQSVTLGDQFTFEFGEAAIANLTDDGQARLARLARDFRELRDVNRVQIVGFADRIGNSPANQALSQRRAEAVRDYLVANGVPAERIQVEGRGVKNAAQCPGPKTPAVIQCLKGDRRVAVSIAGTR